MKTRMKKSYERMGLKCPECGSRYVIKKGLRARRRKTLQQYKCNKCGKYFVDDSALLKSRSYRPAVILGAISSYNMGWTLSGAAKQVNSRFGERIYPKLISNWLSDYNNVCSYYRIRKKIGVSSNPVVEHKFEHEQVYVFKYHKVKLDMFVSKYFAGLKQFLLGLADACPNKLFTGNSVRGSQLKIDARCFEGIKIYKGKNKACELAKLALSGVKDNRKRHSQIQELMLVNDTSTIAVEVPVWLMPDEFAGIKLFSGLRSGCAITGHIDAVQMRYGLVYVLDYKPEAAYEKPISQLFFYAFALSIRTGIWLRNFRCAWFDERGYYEFNPNLIVLKNEKISSAEHRKYWLDVKANIRFTSKEYAEERLKGKGR